MNILMLTNSFPPAHMGGVDTHILELSRALIKLGHHVRIVARARSASAPSSVEGIPVDQVKGGRGGHLVFDKRLAAQLQQLVDTHNIDIVHAHVARRLTSCKKLSVPVIFTNHMSSFVRRSSATGIRGYLNRRQLLRQIKPAQAIITASEILEEKTRAVGFSGPIQFIPNGVDTSKFCPQPSPIRATLGIPEDAFVAVLACRMHPVKGARYLAEALASIDDATFKQTGLHLVVAGDGQELPQFENVLAKKIKEGWVHLLGCVQYQEMPDLYRAADVSILPSLMEGTSLTALEAMACGIPMIASRVGGNPYLIVDGETGILTEPASPSSLRAAILRLATDRTLCAQMGRAAQARVEEHFTWQRRAQQVVQQYSTLLANKREDGKQSV